MICIYLINFKWFCPSGALRTLIFLYGLKQSQKLSNNNNKKTEGQQQHTDGNTVHGVIVVLLLRLCHSWCHSSRKLHRKKNIYSTQNNSYFSSLSSWRVYNTPVVEDTTCHHDLGVAALTGCTWKPLWCGPLSSLSCPPLIFTTHTPTQTTHTYKVTFFPHQRCPPQTFLCSLLTRGRCRLWWTRVQPPSTSCVSWAGLTLGTGAVGWLTRSSWPVPSEEI